MVGSIAQVISETVKSMNQNKEQVLNYLIVQVSGILICFNTSLERIMYYDNSMFEPVGWNDPSHHRDL